MEAIDTVRLNFSPTSLMLMNVIIGLIMFGVALELSTEDFKRVLREPRAAITGLTAQLVLLPAATFLVTLLTDLPPSVELGMMLVAACPGGNVSNFISSLAKANAPLSISMTAMVTTLAVVMTPLNIALWGSWNPATAPLLREVTISPLEMVAVVGLIIGMPVILGMALRARAPGVAARLLKPFKYGSMAFLGVFVLVALVNNGAAAREFIPIIASVVVGHNLVALSVGALAGAAARLPVPDRKTLTIEVGIQNSGLGLVLIFSFFDGMGGMAVVAAFWGIWHIISGLALATAWSRNPQRFLLPVPQVEPAK